MSDNMVVLITGVAGYWGTRLATRLAREKNIHVIGLDNESAPEEIEGLDFIQADIRNPLLVDLLSSESVDTVCHLKFDERVELDEKAYDQNVVGTIKVLEACAEAESSSVILKSSTAVYGAHPDNSAFLTEDMPLRGSLSYGYTRDLVEIEDFVNGFHDQHPQTKVTSLRFANIIGHDVDSPLTRFLRERSPRVLLGFDPVMQLIHEDDVIEALAHVVFNPVPGAFNVAAEGVMPLSRILRMTRKVPIQIFHPLAYWGAKRLRNTPMRSFYVSPIEWDYLRYPWVGDLSQMRERLGFYPLYLMEEMLREFAGYHKVGEDGHSPENDAYDETHLRDIIERRRRARERQVTTDN